MNEQMTMLEPLQDAVEWVADNPHTAAQFLHWHDQDVAVGARPSIALYVEIARRPHFASLLGLQASDESYLINNNLRANLSRLFNRDHRCQFPTRDARADHWGVKDA